MKKILFATALLLTLFSCKKDNPIATQLQSQTDSEISFDTEGNHYAYKGDQTAANGGVGIFALKFQGTPGFIKTFYSLAAHSDPSNQIQLIIITGTDTLKTITYHQIAGNGGTIIIKQVGYSFLADTDYLDVKITSYNNGIVNGNFSGKFSKLITLTNTPQVTISNGVIKNVKINY